MGLFDIFKKGLTASDREELDAKYIAKQDGFSLMSKEQSDKLSKLENYTPPKEIDANRIFVRFNGTLIPMSIEVFNSKPTVLPEDQINIIL